MCRGPGQTRHRGARRHLRRSGVGRDNRPQAHPGPGGAGGRACLSRHRRESVRWPAGAGRLRAVLVDFLIGDTPSCSWAWSWCSSPSACHHIALPQHRGVILLPGRHRPARGDLAARRSALRSSGRSCQPGRTPHRRPLRAPSRRVECGQKSPVHSSWLYSTGAGSLTPQPPPPEEVVDVVGGRAEPQLARTAPGIALRSWRCTWARAAATASLPSPSRRNR